MGFIVNRPIDTPSIPDFFRQLEIVNDDDRINVPTELMNRSLHMGGPVEPGRGFVIHTGEFASASTMKVSGNIRLTATLEILRAIATGRGPDSTMLALGYSGWAAGQLEDEIASNGWLIAEADEDIIFDNIASTKYDRSLALIGVDANLLSGEAGHA